MMKAMNKEYKHGYKDGYVQGRKDAIKELVLPLKKHRETAKAINSRRRGLAAGGNR